MAPRTELHEKLCELLGSRNVYYDPPSNIKMKFPAIEYHLARYEPVRADDDLYLLRNRYELTLMEKTPESGTVGELLRLPYCSHDRSFVSDNMHHNTFTIYY